MTKKHQIILVLTLLLTTILLNGGITFAATSELFFSEYIEGSSNNKALEIYNGTGSAIDLAANAYDVQMYFNGSTSAGLTIDLSGTVASGDVFVLAHSSADLAILDHADQTNGAGWFNGDDVVVLRKNGTIIDSFGQIGVDPGTEWSGGGIGGQNETLRRKVAICAGDSITDDAFDPSLEWDGYPQDTFAGLGSHTANCGEVPPSTPEILLTEIVVTPTGGEFVEVHNPTASVVNLSDYYLTDATFTGDGTYYYNIVTGSNAGGGGFGDFHARFPDGASIDAGDYQTIAMTGSAAFLTEYGIAPDYELFDDGSNDGEQLMREALPGSINGQGGLTNSGEVAILYYWDGQSDLVMDVDYVLWGDKDEAVDKTGVSIDGPDADSDTSSYLPDTAIDSQDVVAAGAHVSGNSWQRDDLTEGIEVASGGNGINGDNETSEDLSVTWCEDTPTPGTATVCIPPSTDWIINEIHADPAGDLSGDANGDGTRDATDDEFIELVNNSGSSADISGWTLSDGFSLRHTFPTGTVLLDQCAIVVFGGGTPTGTFGHSLVQTASSGALGLNNGGDSVTLFDGVGNAASTSYGGEGGDNQSLTRDPDITGADPLVKHTTAAGSGGALFSPGTMIDGSQFAGCPTERKIHEVQGDDAASPLVGKTVIIEGIVVGDFQDGSSGTNGDLNGFFVQEEDVDTDNDPLTSEGIFVFDGSSPAVNVENGDLVRIEGPVSEFNGLTEITSFSGVTVINSNNPLPLATELALPVDAVSDFEAYESMLVTFAQALYISEYFNFDRFGEIVLTSDRQYQPTAVFEPGSPEAANLAVANSLSRITLDDGRTSSNPDPAIHPNGQDFTLTNTFRGGDTVQNVTGVLDYNFGAYKIQPTQGADYSNENPRTNQPDDVGGNLKVASFNVLNYFTTIDSIQDSSSNNNPADDICGPAEDQECRGADDEDEFERQRDKIIAAIATIDADVVGLIEIENHPGDVPTEDLVSGLNDVMGADTYAYVATGAIGTDAIRVAFIYKPAAVSLVGDYAVLDDPSFTDPLDYGEEKSRPALAQTFMDNSNGGIFTAVVNHLKSKGSACGSGDDDPEQGSCNLTRTLGAQALADWLATDPTGSGDPDILIIGDLNSYDKEDPIDTLLAGVDGMQGTGDDDYHDLLFDLVGEEAYSYVFDGQLGYLDYGLANDALRPQVTGITAWHINADEPDLIDYDTTFKRDAQDALYEPNAFRASDHDPVIVGLDLDYTFTSLPPLMAPPTLNMINSGQTAAVQFSLNGDQGLDIFAEGYPQSQTIDCTTQEPTDSSQPTSTPGKSDLQYDPLLDQYTYPWKTEKSWTDTCRQFVFVLDDGTTHMLYVQFVK